jgi:hypothetical protein
MRYTAAIFLALFLGVSPVRAQSHGPDDRESAPPSLVMAVETLPDRQQVRPEFRFVRSMASVADTTESLYLSYMVPTGESRIFETELEELLDARAIIESWTTYRDDDFELRLFTSSPGMRIILNINRPGSGR